MLSPDQRAALHQAVDQARRDRGGLGYGPGEYDTAERIGELERVVDTLIDALEAIAGPREDPAPRAAGCIYR